MRFIFSIYFLAVLILAPALQAQVNTTALQQSQLKSEQTLAKIEAYLNSLKTLKATFRQGTLESLQNNKPESTGTFYMARPNKFRLEYDKDKFLSLSDGRQYIFYDKTLRQTTYLPLASLPFSFLLESDIDFDKSDLNAFAEETSNAYNLYVDNSKGQNPPMTFVFKKSPVRLQSWYYMGTTGESIWVDFSKQEENLKLSADLFRFTDPKRLPNVRGNR